MELSAAAGNRASEAGGTGGTGSTGDESATTNGSKLKADRWLAADEQQMKALHETWFPVRYPDIYWHQACCNQLSLEGWPLFTLLHVRCTHCHAMIFLQVRPYLAVQNDTMVLRAAV